MYSLLIGRYATYKDAYVVISIIETLLVFPLASISTGVFVALFEPKRGWWLAGISLLPLLGYWLYEIFAGEVVMLCLIHEALTMMSAFAISRSRRKALQVPKEQVTVTNQPGARPRDE